MADAVDEALCTRLIGYAALAALISTRVYWIETPENVALGSATLPNAIVIQRISDNPETVIEGTVAGEMARFQFLCLSTTHAGARAIATQVRRALQGYRDSTLLACEFAGGGMDLYDPETRIHHVPVDFFVQY